MYYILIAYSQLHSRFEVLFGDFDRKIVAYEKQVSKECLYPEPDYSKARIVQLPDADQATTDGVVAGYNQCEANELQRGVPYAETVETLRELGANEKFLNCIK
tara:strand:- start:326 stop:634 length:309 start_codon:yes stop_codon:yes gene_type:complete